MHRPAWTFYAHECLVIVHIYRHVCTYAHMHFQFGNMYRAGEYVMGYGLKFVYI